jgi:glycosyltransferase involved in cell wall biosynthesis
VPPVILGDFGLLGRFVRKWLGYIDKYLIFPLQLRRKLRNAVQGVVHICDHSNAVYVGFCQPSPVLVTCHDLLAVRGGLGEDTDCPATFTGRILQKRILRGLGKANRIACISSATAADANRLLGNDYSGSVEYIPLGLSYPYAKISTEEAEARLAEGTSLTPGEPFVLHVGSNLRRKNRDGVLRIAAAAKQQWNGRIVFAGEPLSPDLRNLARQLQIVDRILDLGPTGNELLEALYNRAIALIYPSRFEGFGWPVIEAQACGCPVICANSGPLPETAGDAGLFHAAEDESGFASDLLRLTDPAERAKWSEKSLAHSQQFSTTRMIDQYIATYRLLGAAV